MYSLLRRYVHQKREEWRTQRADLFVDLTRPRKNARVLDLGGNDGEFMERICKRVDLSVTIADIGDQELAKASARGFATVRLREGEPLPFGDREFDIVVCNSVIEHVTLPKSRCMSSDVSNDDWVATSMKNQEAFARELRRVARSYFVQTPHRGFPIEAHTWLPFVGWLPHDATIRVVRVSDRVWVKHCGYVDWNLLGEGDMKRLFPEGSIHVERVLGLPKSLIAYSRA